jgi:hypothetical protein
MPFLIDDHQRSLAQYAGTWRLEAEHSQYVLAYVSPTPQQCPGTAVSFGKMILMWVPMSETVVRDNNIVPVLHYTIKSAMQAVAEAPNKIFDMKTHVVIKQVELLEVIFISKVVAFTAHPDPRFLEQP